MSAQVPKKTGSTQIPGTSKEELVRKADELWERAARDAALFMTPQKKNSKLPVIKKLLNLILFKITYFLNLIFSITDPRKLTMSTKYVLCIGFDKNGRALMVKKTRPSWQKGLLNFPGGKVEEFESDISAVVREYFEETGMRTEEKNWQHFLTLDLQEQGSVQCYRYPYPVSHNPFQISNDEEVHYREIDELLEDALSGKAVSNTAWIALISADPDTSLLKTTAVYR